MTPDYILHEKSTISGSRHKTLDQARGRLIFVAATFMMGFLAVALRLVDLTVLGPSQAEDIIAIENTRPLEQPLRGVITDRNGELLATSLKMASLYADTQLIIDAKTTADNLIRILPTLNYGELLEKLQSGKRFVWIQRNITPREEYEINALGEPGLAFQQEARRLYPYANLTSHIIGYTDVDGKGIAGLEKTYNRLLSGGRAELSLTIDIRLQHILRHEMQAAIDKFSAKGAMGIILDVHNGEILSMVSLPDFDPMYPGDAPSRARFNRNTLGVYEMGSTFKLFSTAAALENGVSFDDTFDAKTPIKIGRFTIRDYHAKNRIMTVPEIFMYSSNIGTAKMVKTIGSEKLKDYFRKMGFMEQAPIEVPEKGIPLLPDPWREVNTLTASYGHGIAVSPLHVVRAAAAIVNGGILPTPTLILDKNRNHGQTVTGTRIISPQTSARMRQLMTLTVSLGTGQNAAVEGYNVGGKTGTAEKYGVGGYRKKALLSSFLAVYPMQNPRYAVLVIVDEPQGIKETYGYATGGWTAAPVVSKVIKRMAPLLNIVPDKRDISGEVRAYFANYVQELEGQ